MHAQRERENREKKKMEPNNISKRTEGTRCLGEGSISNLIKHGSSKLFPFATTEIVQIVF